MFLDATLLFLNATLLFLNATLLFLDAALLFWMRHFGFLMRLCWPLSKPLQVVGGANISALNQLLAPFGASRRLLK